MNIFPSRRFRSMVMCDVLGLGSTTSIDNGEFAFLPTAADNTTIWKCKASDGGICVLQSGDGSAHFHYVCFRCDAIALKVLVDPAELGDLEGRPLQELVGEAITQLRSQGRLAEAPIYGLLAELEWRSLVITVASQLYTGQQRRNTTIASSEASEGIASRSIYQLLQHYRLAERVPGHPADPIRYLGFSLQWDCCAFFDTDPATGRVTIPAEVSHLHLHCCSVDLRHGGHLHHEHPGTALRAVRRLVLYPLQQVHQLASDLAVEQLRFEEGAARFSVVILRAMDVSDVDVAVVVNDRYSGHRYLRLPWLAAGASENFSVPLDRPAGGHRIELIADPELRILDTEALQANNRDMMEVQL